MPAETITTIIARAVAEPEFRGLLFRNAPAALAEYDLSDAERAALSGLNAENFDALAGELEARVSKMAYTPSVANIAAGPGAQVDLY